MPAISGVTLTQWRTHPQIVRGYCYIHVPATVCQRRVNMASFTYPVTSLTFDNPDGDTGLIADVLAGMTLQVRSSANVFKGWARVKSATGTTTGTITIAPVGIGDIDFADDDKLSIWDDYRIWMKVPQIDATTGTLYKDYNIAYTDQNTNIPPIANCTLAVNNLFVTGDPAVITVIFNASPSFPMGAAGPHASEPYTWDFIDGTQTTGGAHDPLVTATFPAGVRYVLLTYKDDNDNTHTKRILIPAFTGPDDPLLYSVNQARFSGTVETGWEASFNLLDADVSDFSEGTQVIYFEDELFGSTNAPLDQNCIKFVGWLTSEPQRVEPFLSDSAINCQGPLGMLQTLPAFPQTLEDTAVPDAWNEVYSLTWWITFVYLVYWHSTVLDIVNLERPVALYSGYLVLRLDSDAASLYDQLQTMALYSRAHFTCDHRGNCYVRYNPQLMTDAERAALTTIVTLADTDWNDEGLDFTYPDQDAVAWIRGSGILASSAAVTPYLSIAPGTTPGQGGQIESLDRQLVVNQADLNARTGHQYANRNKRYYGVRVPDNLALTLAHRGWGFDPAWQEWVKFTLASTTNRRGISFSSKAFVIREITIENDENTGTSFERLTLEPETAGEAGVTVAVPTDGIIDIPIPTWDDPPVIDPIPDSVTVTPDLVYAGDETDIKRSRDFTTTATWETVVNIPTLAGVGYTLYAMCTGHSDSKNRMQIVCSDGTTTLKIYETVNLDTAADWTLKKTISLATYRASLFNPPPYTAMVDVWVLFHQRTNEYTSVYVTDDNWATSTDQVDLANDFGAPNAAAVSPVTQTPTAGKIIVSTYRGASDHYFKVSSDYGGTFPTSVGSFGTFYGPVGAVFPWLNNSSELIWYVWGGSAGPDAYLQKTSNGATFSDITPTYGGTKYGGGHRNPLIHDELHTYTPDPSILSFIAQPAIDGGGGNQRLFISPDGGATWPSSPYEFTTVAHTIGGWPFDDAILFVSGASKLWYTTDSGATMTEKQWVGYTNGIAVIPIDVE